MKARICTASLDSEATTTLSVSPVASLVQNPHSPQLLRSYLGQALRSARMHQERTLREVAKSARVSLGYLSEVERGQKEPSSELLHAICTALGLALSDVLIDVAIQMRTHSQANLVVVTDAA